MSPRCPACQSHEPTTEHLVREYLEMARASFDRVFGHHARKAQRQVGTLLISRGVTEIPNIFGAIPVRKEAA